MGNDLMAWKDRSGSNGSDRIFYRPLSAILGRVGSACGTEQTDKADAPARHSSKGRGREARDGNALAADG